jgi:hypothetical protein
VRQPPFAKAWYAQRVAAEAALARVAADELRNLTEDEALRRSDALLSMPIDAPASRRATSGFVVQQALFARARR